MLLKNFIEKCTFSPKNPRKQPTKYFHSFLVSLLGREYLPQKKTFGIAS
jgi:hypothetical protein